MRASTWIGCVVLVVLLSIPTFAQDQGWIPVHYDPSVELWDAVSSWDPEVTQRRTRLAAATEEVDFEPAVNEHQEYDETLVPAPSEHQPSTVEGNGRRRTRPQRYNGVSQVSKSGESASRSSRRSDLDENAEVTAPKSRVRTSARAESQGRRRTEGRTTEEPSTSASAPRRGGSRYTEKNKEEASSTSAPRRSGVRTRPGYQRSTSTTAPDLTSSASNNEASEVTRRPSVRGNNARRIPPSRAASSNSAAKNVASRSQLPLLASNESSRISADQQNTTSSEKIQNLSFPELNSTLTPVKIQTTLPTLPNSVTSIKSTRNAPLADTIHIVVTPKPKSNAINIVTQKPLSTIKPMSIILVPDEIEKPIPLKNKEVKNLNNLDSVSIAQNVISSTANPINSNYKFKDDNKSTFKIDLSPNQNTQKLASTEKTIQSTTPTNKIIQVKSVTVISNTREEISIRPQKVNTAYSNVTPKSKFVTIVKSVTPKHDFGKAIQINTVSTTAVPSIKIRQKVNTSSFSNIEKNSSLFTSSASKSITTERSLSSNSITPATKTASKLVSVSLKSAILDLSPPITTPKTRPSTTTSQIYNPYISIIKTTTLPSRVSKSDLHFTTIFTTDKSPTTRPSITTSDRPYPVFVPELHSSSTTTPPPNLQQVTSLASKRRKVSTEVKEKVPEIDIDDDDNYPEEFKQRILGGKKEVLTTPAPKKKDALLEVDNLVSKPRELTTAVPRKFVPPTREESDNNIDEDNLVSRPREVNTRLRSSSRSRDVTSTTSAPPRRRTSPQPTPTKAPEVTESSVRTAAAIRTRGELLRKSIRGRSTPQPSSLATEVETTETSPYSSTAKPRYSARQRRPEKDVETDSDNAAPFVQRFSSKYRSDIRGSLSSTPAYVATVPSVTQLPEKEPARRLAKFPSLSLRTPPKRWTPKSKAQIFENRLVTTLPPITHYSSITSSAQASTNIEISTPSPQNLSNTEVQVTLPESSTTNNLISNPENLSLVEIVSPETELSITRARNIIYSSTVSSSKSPSVQVTTPASVFSTRARNIIFSTQEPLTHTLSIEAMFSKSIFSPRSLLLEVDPSTSSSTTESTSKVSNLETYSTISSYLTTPKNNIKPDEMISSTTTERTLTTRQATSYPSSTSEKLNTIKQATTVRSTTVQYTSSYSKVASIGLNPATTPIPSVVLASSAPDIATPPPRFAMRIPIAPIGTKSSTPTPHTTTIRHSTFPLNSVTTTHKIMPSIHSFTTSTVKPVSTSVRTATSATPMPNLSTSTTFKPSTTSSKPVTSTTPKSSTVKHDIPQSTTMSVKLITISSSTQNPIPSTTVRLTTPSPINPVQQSTYVPSTTVKLTTHPTSTQKPITSTTVRLTTPKPTISVHQRTHVPSTTAKPTTHKTTTTYQPPKHLETLTKLSVPDQTEVITKDNEIPQISLAVPPPARDPAARGLQFTNPSGTVIFTSPSPSPRSSSFVVSSTPLISLSLVETKTEEPLTALSSSVSLSTEPTLNITTTERSTYIYKIPPNPNKSLPTTTETPVQSTTQFRWKPVTAAASTSVQSESTSSKTQIESEPSKTLSILENLVQATKDKINTDSNVYTVTPQTPAAQSTTTEFEGLSLANLAYKPIVRNRGPNTTQPPRSSTTSTSTTTSTTAAPSRGRKVPTDSIAIISDNSETSNSGRRPNKQANNNNGDGNKMAVWIVPKNSASSSTTTSTTSKPLSGELGGLTAQDLLLLEILSKRRPSTAVAAPAPSVSFGGGLDLATLIAAGDNVHDDSPPPVRSTTRRPRITTTTTQAPFYQDDPEPSGGGGAAGGFQGSGSSLLHILRAIGGASSVPQAPAAAPVKYEPQEDVILEPATTTTRTRGRQRNPSRRPPVTERTTTTEEPYYDVEPETNQQPSQLVTVAINVTKTVASLMGRVLQGAARTVSAVVRESTRQISGYLQNWQQPQQ